MAKFLTKTGLKSQIPEDVFHTNHCCDISEQNGFLLFDNHFVIPKTLRVSLLSKIHEGHQGITRFSAFAKVTVWLHNWYGTLFS